MVLRPAFSLPTSGKPEEKLVAACGPLFAHWEAAALPGFWWVLPIQRGQERLDLFWQGDDHQAEAAAAAATPWAAGLGLAPAPPAVPAALEPSGLYRHQAELRGTLVAIYGETSREICRAWSAASLPPKLAVRLRSFFYLVISGLTTVHSEPAAWLAYLQYYRNTLIRDSVLRARLSHPKIRQLLERFEEDAKAWRPDGLERLRRLFDMATAEAGDGEPESSHLLPFKERLRQLARLAAAEGVAGDAFAATPLDTLLAKVFHHAAAVAGLRQLEEAFALHLLLLALGAEGDQLGCSLLPPQLRHTEGQLEHELGFFDFENNYRWLELIAATGPAGRAWASAYKDTVEPVTVKVSEAVANVRRKDWPKAEALLQSAKDTLDSLQESDKASADVMARFYYGALAYLHYCRGDFEAARRALDQALEAIVSAVRRDPYLAAFSLVSTDLPLKRARLARESGQWQLLFQELSLLHQLLLGLRPLLVGADGFELRLEDIARPHAESTDELLAPSLRYLRDPAFRQRHYLQLAGNLCHPMRQFLGPLR